MNKPSAAFFPFTFIPDHLARACLIRFGPVVVYQPAKGVIPENMRSLEQEGGIVLRYPATGDDRRLTQLARWFHDWGGMHEKAAAALKKFAENGFYNQDFVPEISTEILKGPKETEPDPGPVFHARLFLLLAQEYDRQTAEMEAELSMTDRAARELFFRIRGGMNEDTGFSNGFDDSGRTPDTGAYMTESRLRAWHFLLDADPEPPPLFITSSPAVISALHERFESMVPLDGLPEDMPFSLPEEGRTGSGWEAEFYHIRECSRVICLLTRVEE